jgi:hypothetical protein
MGFFFRSRPKLPDYRIVRDRHTGEFKVQACLYRGAGRATFVPLCTHATYEEARAWLRREQKGDLVMAEFRQ